MRMGLRLAALAATGALASCGTPAKLEVCLRSVTGLTLPANQIDRQSDVTVDRLSDGEIKVTTSVDEGRLRSLGSEGNNPAAYAFEGVTRREYYIERTGVMRRIIESSGYNADAPREVIGEIVPSQGNVAAKRQVERLVTCLSQNGYKFDN